MLQSRTLRGMHVPYCFGLATLDEFLLADAFFEYWWYEQQKFTRQHVVADTDSHITFTEENVLERPTMVDKRAMQDEAEKELFGQENMVKR